MAAGRPVVGYDLPSSRQTFGDAIATVRFGDIQEFAAAIIALLNNPVSYKEYQSRGLKVAEKYNWDTIADAFFQRIIGNGA
jgi:glycosyltransferase involved in cell wall biosynthesis